MKSIFAHREKLADELKLDHPKIVVRIASLKSQKADLLKAYKHFEKGNGMMANRLYDGAIAEYGKFLVYVKQNSGYGHFNLGLAYLMRSIQNIEVGKVLEENLFFAVGKLRGQVDSTWDADDVKKAEDQFELAQKYSFNSEIVPRIAVAMATYYTRIENHNKSLKYAQIAIKKNPFSSIYYNVLGNSFYHLKEYKKAINFYKTASFLNNTNLKSYYNLAATYLTIKDKKNAKKWSRKFEDKKSLMKKLDKDFGLKYTKPKKIKPASFTFKVKINQSQKKVEKLLGKPILKNKFNNKFASYLILTYRGIQILLIDNKVKRIILVGRSKHATKKKIKIGSNIDKVLAQYGLPDQSVQNMDGSLEWEYDYHKIRFRFRQGVVVVAMIQ